MNKSGRISFSKKIKHLLMPKQLKERIETVAERRSGNQNKKPEEKTITVLQKTKSLRNFCNNSCDFCIWWWVNLLFIFGKQKIFELISFAAFSLYVILSYGFEYFFQPDFSIIYQNQSLTKMVGDRVELYCQADAHWEWCRSELCKSEVCNLKSAVTRLKEDYK